MRFDIPAIASQIANKIVGMVDAEPSKYLETDFADLGTQRQLLDKELIWLLDYQPVAHVYDRLVEQVQEHPEMKMVFTTGTYIVDAYKEGIAEAELEQAAMERQYRRDVL